MQWNLVTNSSNPADYPEPGEQVLGLWLGGFWKKVMYSPDVGWYTSRDGVEQAAPTWWGRVDTAIAKQLPPQGDVSHLRPATTVTERVRGFLAALIAARDCTANGTMPAEIVGEYECYDDWAADTAIPLLEMLNRVPATPATTADPAGPPLALDVSLEKARALHRVWRALNDGDCPNCHKYHAATEILRSQENITCPSCWFHVKKTEIAAIEKMFAPAMNAAVAIFNQWRDENNNKQENMDAVG